MAKTIGDYFLRGLEQGQERGFKAAQSARNQQQKADLENYLMGQKIKAVEDLRAKYPDQDVGAEGVYIRERDQLGNDLRSKQIQNLEDERSRRAVQDIEDRATKAGTAQMVPALKRAEEAVPGLFTRKPGEPGPELKSYGGTFGWRGLVPNIAVQPLERLGALPEGATKERLAFQELANVKIYDSSGKQINEQEMKRLLSALGLQGITNPGEIINALGQMGMTVLEKQKQVSAGAEPEALQKFKQRGGLAGYETLPELMYKGQVPGQAPVSPKDAERKRLEELRAKARGQ